MISSYNEKPHDELRGVSCHGITQCYLPPDTSAHLRLTPASVGWYSIYLYPEGWKAELT